MSDTWYLKTVNIPPGWLVSTPYEPLYDQFGYYYEGYPGNGFAQWADEVLGGYISIAEGRIYAFTYLPQCGVDGQLPQPPGCETLDQTSGHISGMVLGLVGGIANFSSVEFSPQIGSTYQIDMTEALQNPPAALTDITTDNGIGGKMANVTVRAVNVGTYQNWRLLINDANGSENFGWRPIAEPISKSVTPGTADDKIDLLVALDGDTTWRCSWSPVITGDCTIVFDVAANIFSFAEPPPGLNIWYTLRKYWWVGVGVGAVALLLRKKK